MQAICFTTKNRIELVEKDKPALKPGHAVIRVARAGLCGTDLHILRGEYFNAFPLVAGHEFSGVIDGIADNDKGFRPGDRVTADPNISCGSCHFCKKGKYNQCENFAAVGVTGDGAFAEYVSVPVRNIAALPDVVPFEAGALVEPVSCILTGLKKIALERINTVLVFGAGTMGILIHQVLRVLKPGLHVCLVDINDYNLGVAARLTENVFPNDRYLSERLKPAAPFGFDLVIDATGSEKVMRQTFDYVEPGGSVWLFGVAAPDATLALSPYSIFKHDLTILGSFAVNRTFTQARNLVERSPQSFTGCVSHAFPFTEFQKSFDFFTKSDHLKIQLVF